MSFPADQVPLFLAVLDHGSFSAAARRLGRVPSAVSMAIAQLEAELDRLRAPLAGLAERTGLALEPGRFVLELRPQGADKGRAIADLAAARAPAAILFCGDDLGDKAAFAAVRHLREDGTPGLLVCSWSAEVPELAAEADLVVDGPDGIAGLLADLANAFAGQASGGPANPVS